jgi:hypothetical protein
MTGRGLMFLFPVHIPNQPTRDATEVLARHTACLTAQQAADETAYLFRSVFWLRRPAVCGLTVRRRRTWSWSWGSITA